MSPLRRPFATEPAVALRGVSKSYRIGIDGCMAVVRVLTHVDLVVSSGERVAIVGAPGSGKTTLLLIAAGALRCDTGSVCLHHPASMSTRSTSLPHMLRGVAERGRAHRAGNEVLWWAEPRRTQLIAVRSLRDVTIPVDRVLRLHCGRLHPESGCVDSPSKPP